jgi:molecular chaperone GrpE
MVEESISKREDRTEAGEAEREQTVPGTEELMKELEQERSKAREYLENWQRAEAELRNYRRRVDQERADLSKQANSRLIQRLLPVVDDFERALATVPSNLQILTWIQGVVHIYRKLMTVLEQEGVRPIDALGKPFDPKYHEAILYEEGSDGTADHVVAELQRGYMLHDRVIRPALVKVGKLPSETASSASSEEKQEG